MVRFFRFLMVMFCLLVGTTMALAQPRNFKVQAEGTVVDSKTSEPLFAATIKATSADGGTGTFAITDTLGRFKLEFDHPGKYTLEFSYMGYKPINKEVQIWSGRGAKLGKFRMTEDAKYLKEVETVGRNQRVKQVGDTIAYNADAYKVQDGAAAEDLIKKMPGMEVTSTGVKAQGETVEKILVDGKAFFENDPMLALKTLPAEVIQSVAVFDKKSDQAEFTGVDDGNTVKAMDIATKSYRRNGVFGKVYGSLGNNLDLDNMYWNAGFNLNFFNGDRRISLLGMSNNVNQQDFTFDDLEASGGMGGGFPGGGWGFRRGAAGGVSRANAFGLQFSDNYLDGKLDVQGSYFFNNVRTQSSDSSYTDYISRTQSSISSGNSVSHSYRHRMEMRINYIIDENNDLLFRPSINLQQNDSRSASESAQWKYNLADVMSNNALRGDKTQMMSWSESENESENTSWNVGGSLLWRHKFSKPGRTLSIEGQISRSGSESENQSNRDGSAIQLKIANGEKPVYFQQRNGDQKNWRSGGNVQYTESINDNNQLSLRYRLNYTNSENETEVDYFDTDKFLHIDSIDVLNSSHYETKQLQHGGEVMWRYYNDIINFNVGANLQGSVLEGEQIFNFADAALQKEINYSNKKSYFNVLPNLRFEWNAGNGTSFNINYRTRVNSPSLSQLQQSLNTGNVMAYSTGNSLLDQSFGHNVNLRFIHSNMEKATNIMVYSGFNATQDNIGTVTVINDDPLKQDVAITSLDYFHNSEEDLKSFTGVTLPYGSRVSRPVNLGNQYSLYAGMTYGFPLDLLRSNVNLSLNGNLSSSPSLQLYYTGKDKNGELTYERYDTEVRRRSLSPSIRITSNISADLDFSLNYAPSYSRVIDEENPNNNSEYLDHTAGFNLKWTFWRGFTTEQTVNYMFTDGGKLSKDRSEAVWNLSFGKKFLKANKAEIKLQVFDVLGEAKGFTRSVDETNGTISMRYQNFMPRYFLLTFTYKIANYKNSSSKQSTKRANQDMEPGFPGGFPGGGFPGGGRGGFGGGRF